jgi:hypothetical protein
MRKVDFEAGVTSQPVWNDPANFWFKVVNAGIGYYNGLETLELIRSFGLSGSGCHDCACKAAELSGRAVPFRPSDVECASLKCASCVRGRCRLFRQYKITCKRDVPLSAARRCALPSIAFLKPRLYCFLVTRP